MPRARSENSETRPVGVGKVRTRFATRRCIVRFSRSFTRGKVGGASGGGFRRYLFRKENGNENDRKNRPRLSFAIRCSLLLCISRRLETTARACSIMKYCTNSRSAQHRGGILYGGPRVRKLRCNFHSVMAAGRYRTLPLQRMRSLPQDERNESALGEAAAAIGKKRKKAGLFSLSGRTFSPGRASRMQRIERKIKRRERKRAKVLRTKERKKR